jgi:hypothetical protein
LGQRDFKGKYSYDVTYEYYIKERPDHRRICFDDGDKNNNEIIELFHRHMNHMRVIIQTCKGTCDVLIVSDKDKTDYTKIDIALNPLSKNYNGWGTVDIIVDILKCVHKPVPIVSTISKEMFGNTSIIKNIPVIGNTKTTSTNNRQTMSSFLTDYIFDKRMKELQRRK